MDFEVLAKSLGRSVDDTVLCIHMVLAQMTAHVNSGKLLKILDTIALLVFEELGNLPILIKVSLLFAPVLIIGFFRVNFK